jgi:hypothetical protein
MTARNSLKKTKLKPCTQILHTPETQSWRWVDIVVVHLFSKTRTGSALNLFEAQHNSPTTENDRANNRGQNEVEKEPEGISPEAEPKSSTGATNPTGHHSQSASLRTPSVNWLKDPEMLPKAIPDARIISIGYEIPQVPDSPPLDVDSAATELVKSLASIRSDCSRRPILFIGHGYGGIFIEEALIQGAWQDHPAKIILDTTAGMFLFSCPVYGSDRTRELLAKAYGMPATARIFEDMSSESERFKQTAYMFNQKVMEEDNYMLLGWYGEIGPRPRRHKGFPIFQYVSAEERPSQGEPQRITERPRLDRLLDPAYFSGSTIVLKQELGSLVKFLSFGDSEFQLVAKQILWAVRTHQLLDAAAGAPEDMEALLLDPGVKVNLQDQWYVSNRYHIAHLVNFSKRIRTP